jgi:group II intron reverse transcriptase/maturase
MKRTNKGAQPEIKGQAPAEVVEKSPPAKGNCIQASVISTQRLKGALIGLNRVREAAKRDKNLRFTNLLHHIDIKRLQAAYQSLNPKAAAGVDEVTWKEYGEGLEARLITLLDQIHSGRYRAKASKRIWIPKSDGRQRPIGISALEDKIVQQALVSVLEPIYEEDFLGFSYGSRPGRSQHNGLDAIYVAITQRKVSWILDADIRGFYDNLNHERLMEFVEHRVADKRVLRLIRKFLRAGVSEDGKWSKTVVGTPQGSVISPLLANIYLHYALDLWVKWWRNHHARGEVYIVRYSDDFVLGFQYRSDAVRFQTALRKRMGKCGLELHDDKTRLIEFGRFATENRKSRGEGKPETFDFLGLTHICSTRRKDGHFKLHRKTIAKRLRSKIKEVRQILQRHRHKPVREQGIWLRSVVQGHFNYYAVPGNREALDSFRTQIGHAWLHALRRRSHKGKSLTWERMQRQMMKWIPTARVLHPYPNQRLCV